MKQFRIIKETFTLIFCVTTFIILSISVYAEGNAYGEDFFDASVLGTSGTPWTYTTGTYDCPMKISNGKLTRDAGGSDYRKNAVTFNSITTNGGFDCYFDLSLSYGYSANDGDTQVNFVFNKNNGSYYALVFRLSPHSTKGYLSRSVNLIKVTNWSTHKLIMSCPYEQMPTAGSIWRNFNLHLKVADDGAITVDCINKDNNAKTRLFDNVYDNTGSAKLTTGKISIENCSYLQFTFDNFYLNNGGYTFKNALYYNVGNNVVSVKADALVPKAFTSAILAAGVYDENGKLIAIDSKPYNSDDVNDGVISYENNLITNTGNAANVKLFLWNSILGMTPQSLTRICGIDPLGDLKNPPFVQADVPHANVPTETAPSKISDSLSSLVVKTYPEGKMKALIMSFDDGGNDYNLVVPTLNDNGLKAAFNVNRSDSSVTSGVFIGLDRVTGKPIWSGSTTGDYYKQIVNELYAGHEISSHTLNHKTESVLSKDNFRYELGQSKYVFENLYGREVAGFAQAGGNNAADAEIAPAEWRLAYIKYIGYRYIRHAPFQAPGTGNDPTKFTFPLPTDFFDWYPTIKITEDPNSAFTRVDLLNAYMNLDPANEMRVFFGWGHGTELGSLNWDTYVLTPNGNFTKFVDFCTLAKQNLDTIWNPTVINLVDYVNASRLIEVSQETDGNIKIHNPSTEITVWLKIRGENTPVAPGETIFK